MRRSERRWEAMLLSAKTGCESAGCVPGRATEHNKAGKAGKRAGGRIALLLLLPVILFCLSACGKREEPLHISFYYENVCASCEGDADFYAMYNRCISPDEKENLNVEIATYNVFMDSCQERYEKEAERLGIPQGTSMPVLIIGDQWFDGYEKMEDALHRVLLEE